MLSNFKIILIICLLLGGCSKKVEEDPEPSTSSTTANTTSGTSTTSTTGIIYSNDFCGKYKMTAKDSVQSTNGADAPSNPEFKDIVVNQNQHSFIALFTGLWCTPCGNRGVGTLDSLAKAGLPNIHFVSAQMDDSLSPANNLNNYFAGLYGINAYPAFTEAGGLYHQSPLYQNAILFAEYRRDKITPIAGVGLKSKLCGSDILVKAKVKIYSNCTKPIKIQLFLIEDEIFAPQAYYPNTKIMKHSRVIRETLIKGSLISGTEINLKGLQANQGEEFHFKYKYPIISIPGMKTKNLRVLAVVWQNDDSALTEFINCNEALVE